MSRKQLMEQIRANGGRVKTSDLSEKDRNEVRRLLDFKNRYRKRPGKG